MCVFVGFFVSLSLVLVWGKSKEIIENCIIWPKNILHMQEVLSVLVNIQLIHFWSTQREQREEEIVLNGVYI